MKDQWIIWRKIFNSTTTKKIAIFLPPSSLSSSWPSFDCDFDHCDHHHCIEQFWKWKKNLKNLSLILNEWIMFLFFEKKKQNFYIRNSIQSTFDSFDLIIIYQSYDSITILSVIIIIIKWKKNTPLIWNVGYWKTIWFLVLIIFKHH